MGGINLKRFLLVLVCLVGIFGSSTAFQQDVADDEKPPITKPISHEDIS